MALVQHNRPEPEAERGIEFNVRSCPQSVHRQAGTRFGGFLFPSSQYMSVAKGDRGGIIMHRPQRHSHRIAQGGMYESCIGSRSEQFVAD